MNARKAVIISPITPSRAVNRPLWSVMIPTYNSTKFLGETLESVLAQNIPASLMQITVVDNKSTKDDPKQLVETIGKGRVEFVQNETNLGPIKNWNVCVAHARGEWVHVLHADDRVHPGFYQELADLIQQHPEIGAAYTGYSFIGVDSKVIQSAPLEMQRSGVQENFLDRVGAEQHMIAVTIVVKREAYERLGAFDTRLYYTADWEMWMRLGAHVKVGYIPKVLAEYRLHPESCSASVNATVESVHSFRKAIEIGNHYIADKRITGRARAKFGKHAVEITINALRQRRLGRAIQLGWAGFRLNPSLSYLATFIKRAMKLFFRKRKRTT